ncbi:hypothetical protein G8V09_13995 [Clostridium botulinum D/C]|nr:hypothetical protein [Clostridium botulinum D/C]
MYITILFERKTFYINYVIEKTPNNAYIGSFGLTNVFSVIRQEGED